MFTNKPVGTPDIMSVSNVITVTCTWYSTVALTHTFPNHSECKYSISLTTQKLVINWSRSIRPYPRHKGVCME